MLVLLPFSCLSQTIFLANGKQHTMKYEQLNYEIYFDYWPAEISNINLRLFFTQKDTLYTSADSSITFFSNHHYDLVKQDSVSFYGFINRSPSKDTNICTSYSNGELQSVRKTVYNSDNNITYEHTKLQKSEVVEIINTWFNEIKQDSFSTYTINDTITAFTYKHHDTGEYSETIYLHYLSSNTRDTIYRVPFPYHNKDTISINHNFPTLDITNSIKNEISEYIKLLKKVRNSYKIVFLYQNNVTCELSLYNRQSVHNVAYNLQITINKMNSD